MTNSLLRLSLKLNLSQRLHLLQRLQMPREREPAAKKKRGAAKGSAEDDDDDEVPKSKIMASMPSIPKDGSSPRPVKYWGGIIYTATKAKKFRALKKRGDRYTEASASWGTDKPTKAAWTKCVSRP